MCVYIYTKIQHFFLVDHGTNPANIKVESYLSLPQGSYRVSSIHHFIVGILLLQSAVKCWLNRHFSVQLAAMSVYYITEHLHDHH